MAAKIDTLTSNGHCSVTCLFCFSCVDICIRGGEDTVGLGFYPAILVIGTCSIIFGKASHSQMRYLQALAELQQSMLNSCDSLLAKQPRWFEDNLPRNNNSTIAVSSELKAFVRSYIATVDMSMTMVSIVYDFATSQIERYKQILFPIR